MPVANTVEATLRSRYVDGISEGIRRTQQTLSAAVSFMTGMWSNFSAAVTGGADSAFNALAHFGMGAVQQSNSTSSSFNAMSLAVIGFSVLAVAWFARLVASLASWTFGVAKAASDTLELKLIFEGLAKTAGVDASDAVNKLRVATEGLISSQVLLKNANRVLQADIPITIDQYVKLVDNVYKLAKASGTDAVSAQNMLTDAVVKGNARGFQQIGVQLQIKDAINEMALQQGIATNKIETDTRLRGFYNELLAKTSEAVKRNGTDYFSFADAVEKTEKTMDRWTAAVGEALGRSGVFAEMLRRYSGYLDEINPRQALVNDLALGFNRALIVTLKTIDFLLLVLAGLAPIFNTVLQIGLFTFHGLSAAFGFAGTLIVALISSVLQLGNALAKVVGVEWFDGLSKQMEDLTGVFARATGDMATSAADAVGNIFSLEATRTLAGYSNGIHALVGELEQYKGIVVEGQAGTRSLAEAQALSAETAKKLREETKALYELMRQLGNALSNPSEQNLNTLLDTFRKIDQFQLVSQEARDQARLRALDVYRQAQVKIAIEGDKVGQEKRQREVEMIGEAEQLQAESDKRIAEDATRQATEYTQRLRVLNGEVAREGQALFDAVIAAAAKKRQEEQQKAINESVATANAIAKAIELSRSGKLSRETGEFALAQAKVALAELQAQLAKLQQSPVITGDQIDQVLKLKAAIEQLNRVQLTPFQAMIAETKALLKGMVMQTLDAFSSLMADLVSGQENAGKKFLAALIGMVADGLIYLAKLAAGYAIMKAISGDWGGAAVAAAGAVALAASAGILKGLASNLAQTNQAAGSSGSFQQTTPRPIGGSTQQIVNVGAPGRAQDIGAAQQPMQHELTVRVEAAPGWVVKEVSRNIKGNGELRTLMTQYAG